jgi:hypothetical protein
MTNIGLKDMKFGFEYETIIGVDTRFTSLLEKYNELVDMISALTKADGICDITSDTPYYVRQMHLLAMLYNRHLQSKDIFKVLDSEVCSEPFMLDQSGDIKRISEVYQVETYDERTIDGETNIALHTSSTGHWVILADESVKKSTLKTQYYESLSPGSLVEEYNGSITKYLENIEIITPIMDMTYVEDAFSNILDKTLTLTSVNENKSIKQKLVYLNNTTTSNHVHVSCKQDESNVFSDPDKLLKICICWRIFEPVFMLMVGHWRRDNEYCVSMRTILDDPKRNEMWSAFISQLINPNTNILDSFTTLYASNFGAISSDKLAMVIAFFQGTSRRSAFNMHNLIAGKGTIEVRLKHGSTSIDENKNFILLLGLFFAACVNKELPASNDISQYVRLHDKLASLPTWKSQTSVVMDDNIKQELTSMITSFFDFIKPNVLSSDIDLYKNAKVYWIGHLNTLHSLNMNVTSSGGRGRAKRVKRISSLNRVSTKDKKRGKNGSRRKAEKI